jgi:hypothetical protein
MRSAKLASVALTDRSGEAPGSGHRVKPLVPSRSSLFAALDNSLSRFAIAAGRGYYALMTEAEEASVRATVASDACVLLHSGGAWRRWDHVDAPGNGRSVSLPPDVSTWRVPTPLADGLFVPIRPGVLAAVATAPRDGKETESIASSLASALELALTALERKGLAFERATSST